LNYVPEIIHFGYFITNLLQAKFKLNLIFNLCTSVKYKVIKIIIKKTVYSYSK